MVAIDRNINTATITLLTMHPMPYISSDGWSTENIRWTIAGEIKMPLPVMDTLMIYYLQEISNGLNIVPLIQKHLGEHPIQNTSAIKYGPTQVRQS